MRTDRTHAQGTTSRASPVLLSVVLCAIFVLGASVVWFLGLDRGRGQYDQINYHLPVIRQFESHWPSVDLSDYQSATTPGYHLVLAGLSKLGVRSELGLRIAASTFSLTMFALLAVMLVRRGRDVGVGAGPGTGALVIFALPVVCSMYVFAPGVWLQPDNAGWLGVLAMIALTWNLLDSPRPTLGSLALQSAVLLALVFTRQSHLWAGGLVIAAAWLGAAPIPSPSIPALLSEPLSRTRRALLAACALIPALLLLFALARLWHGLTPPSFHAQHSGGNLATPAFTLALLAIYSAFFAPMLLPPLVCLWRERRIILFLAGAIGLALALIPETTYLREPRSGGLWNFVQILDARGIVLFGGHTSPLILVLAPLGAIAASVWLSTLTPARSLYALALLVGFTLAQSANANAWQRYLEPMLLLLIALAAAGLPARSPIPLPRPLVPLTSRPLQLLGPCALSLLLTALTVQSLTRTERFPVPTNPKAIPSPAAGVSPPPPATTTAPAE